MQITKLRNQRKHIWVLGMCIGMLLSNIGGECLINASSVSKVMEAEKISEIQDNDFGICDFYLNGSGKNIDGEAIANIVENGVASPRTTSFYLYQEESTAYTTSDQGFELIKNFEGCRLKAYKAVETEVYYTIGYGHYGPDVTKDMVITQEKADAMFREDMQEFEGYVNKFLDSNNLRVTQNQFDALVSFTYNCGTKWMSGSTIRNYLLNGIKNYSKDDVINAFSLWNTSGGKIIPGLTIRRRKEAAFFLGDMSLVAYKKGKYKVEAGELTVRTGPGTTYEAAKANGADLKLKKDDVVTIHELKTPSAYTWGRCDSGWIMLEYCRLTKETDSGTEPSTPSSETDPQEPDTPSETETEEDYPIGFYEVIAGSLNVRSGPGTNNKVVKVAKKGERYHITQTSGRWGKTSVGWLSLKAEFCKVYKLETTSITEKSNTATGIRLKWNVIKDADGYCIYRRTKSGDFAKIKTISSKSTDSYVDSSAKNGSWYQYKICSYCKIDGSTCKSPVSSAKTMVCLKGTSITKAKSPSAKKLVVNWKKDGKVNGYQMQYSMDSNFVPSEKKGLTIKSNGTVTKTFSKLTRWRRYYIRVRTYKTVDGKKYYSDWSTSASVVIA